MGDLAQWLGLTPNVVWVLIGVAVLTASAQLVVAVRRPALPTGRFQNLTQRVKTWWIILGLIALALAAGETASLVLFALVSFLALKEYFSIVPIRRADRRLLFWAYLAIPCQYVVIALGWYGAFLTFVPLFMLLWLSMRIAMTGETEGFLKSVGTVHWGLMMTVFALGHAAYLLALPTVENPAGGGPALLVFLLCLTGLNDVAQYLAGRSFGRRAIAPHVSPNKTWAGFAGGVAATTAAAGLLGPYLTPLDIGLSIAAGLLIAIAGFMGDLMISALKRDLKIKDTGNSLPGHGGLLDRLDSLFVTAPLFFHFLGAVA